MPRRRRAEIREVAPDAVYNSTLVEKFVNLRRERRVLALKMLLLAKARE